MLFCQQVAPQINPWAQFGLAGLVIFSLFGLLVLGAKWVTSHVDEQAKSHQQERSEWKASDDKKTEDFRGTVDRTVQTFAETIKEITRQNR